MVCTLKKVTTAFILGAGLGTRLRPYTDTTPKPLLPVDGKPLICHTFERLIEAGIEHFIVNTHHCPEKYTEAFPDFSYCGIPITFRYEPELLETAGGLKNIEDLIPAEQSLLLYNGDIWSDMPLQPLWEAHFSNAAEVTLALRTEGQPRNVNLHRTGNIRDFRRTLYPEEAGNTLYTGIALIHASHLNRLTPNKKESLVSVWIDMIRQDHPPQGVIIDEGNWNDIGTVEIYEKIQSAYS